ncbi:PREDICTED: proteasome-associated protein ECM29 homolog isoform X1 [Tarenaya hassleriana]|uniref:proteasome-associated protein ECM29 homolog isoform X2 n=1 Tax=Tarenaya hassleriana TaxID=28532 RepID=UPI00053CA854|nr:PREDICTED: proteasome-associated protein ECM29 homolog isoform X2 [Tarenaya hassleriana]XP_010521565.1 PREDICTED: proteasome-associated protein ECM29 homolog isoform X1 [Tarenaya hassleriana]
MEGSSSSSPLPLLSAKSDGELEEMLDRMLTRLALCDDSKLEALLSKLLPLTISSLSSQSPAVRNKVLEILSHVNKRVKHQSEIGLPLLDLWKLYTDPAASPMVKNFAIVYVEMAFERAPSKETEVVASVMLENVSKLPQQHQEIILRIVVKVIGECHASQISDDVSAKYKSLVASQDKDLFLEFCLHMILYQPSPQGGGSPPGLSVFQINRIVGKQMLKGDTLTRRKLGILNVIGTMDLPGELVYPLYVAASVDSQEPVAKKGEDLLKKKTSGANLDDPNLINRLFILFNGTTPTEHVAPEHRITPVNASLKVKLMSVFSRSITAANSFPATLQCIFGCIYGSGTTLRLKQMGMEFTVWVFKHGKIEQLKLMGPVILNAILKMLDGYSTSEADALARETKTFSFQAIGLIGQRLPQLFREKTDIAVRLFDALKLETQSVRSTIQESTISVAAAYKDAPENILRDLEVLLLENSQAEQSEARFCALRWATSLSSSQHCPSRYICMLSAADSKLDIRELALEGLFLKDEGRHIVSNLDNKYPRFGDMLEYILKQQPKLLDSSEIRGQKLLFPSQVYVVMIKFLLKCFELEMEQSNSLATSSEFLSSAQRMCLLLEHSLAFEGSYELHACASKAFVTIGSHLQEMVAVYCSHKIAWLRQLLNHMDFSTRESAGRLLGIASSALSDAESCSLLRELASSVSQPQKLRFEAQHGILCAIGYVAADCLSRTPAIPEAVIQDTVKFLTDRVNSETAQLASVAMQALGHIGLRAALPRLISDSCPGAQVLGVLQEKLSKLLSGDDIKAIQKIVLAVGHICSKETSSSHFKSALDLIFSLSRSKVEEILFAAGEALSFIWGGVPVTADMILKTNYTSLSTNSNFLMREVNSLSNNKSDVENEVGEDSHAIARETITRKLFDVLLYSSRKDERCAGTVWLLSVTMYSGHHPSIQQMLPEIQEAFSHLLGDQNELTQELASQGMSIVYDLGDASMKQNLVDALVNTLTGTGKRKRAIKLVEDSEVFQEGTVGESPSGGKLSTYKELCSLANEMGQPDLIYKFMDLANHQASLNSKRGAAFGFSKIAKQAGDALQPHLRLLIPRLIRYQYDPDKNVQDAMAHIWKSLVQDPRKTVDDHLDLILDDLLVQCGSRLWRSREASCHALADIIQGRKFDQIQKHLKRLWIAAFRAMDDIKETVRNAGDKLCRAVTSLTIRLCDVTLTDLSDAKEAMGIVLPFLLSEGILSKVDSVRKASIGVVMKLAKGAGIALRPHLSDLVCCMLESLSSLEDQGLNYVELHAANIGIETEKLENLRISISKGSPMWETLDLCINIVNRESLDQLIPRLSQLVRAGVGLNTRVGVASFISLLVQKVGIEIKPFTGMLLRLLFPVAKEEKSAAAKRAFASACGLVLKYSSPSQAERLIEDIVALHSGDRNSQISCAILFKSFSSTASDIVASHQSAIVPAIFISRFEDDKQISGLFEEVWEDSTSGERVTLQLFLEEIVSLLCESITSSSWASKKKSARAICKLAEALGESLSSHHSILLQCLLKEIPGRLWEGKDALLDALGALSTSCHKSISTADPTTPSTILSVVSSACGKKVKKYRESAFCCLEKVIKAFRNPEFFDAVFPLLYEMCNTASVNIIGRASSTSDAVKTESDNVEEGYIPLDKIMDCFKSCINVANTDDILKRKADLVHILIISLSPGFPWSAKISGISSIKELCSRLQTLWNDSTDGPLPGDATSFTHEIYLTLIPKLLECINTVKIAHVHVAASQCLLDLIHLYRKVSSAHRVDDVDLKAEILSLLEVEKNEEAKSLLRKSIDALGFLSR